MEMVLLEDTGQQGKEITNINNISPQRMSKAQDLTGQRFGLLTVVERSNDTYDKSGRKYITWKCRCDCGNITYVTSSNLRGKTRSCGCYLKSIAGQQTLKHGYRKTRLYSIYNGMKQRCNNPKHVEYKNYGGRGIRVCDEWNRPDGLKDFAGWALSSGYQNDLTLERKNIDGNYCPENCCWIPMAEQAKNRTNTIYIDYLGERLILSDFSRKVGIDHRKVSRYIKCGMSVDEILRKEGKE